MLSLAITTFLFLCFAYVIVDNSASDIDPDRFSEADFRGSYRRMEMGP